MVGDILCLSGVCSLWLVVACVVDAVCDLQSLESTNYTGVLIWKITDFAKKRQDARQGRMTSVYSPPFYTSQAGQYTQATVSGHLLHLTGRSVHSGHCLRPPSTPHRQVSTLRPLSQATFYTSQAGQYTQATVSGPLLHLTGRSVHSGHCLRPPSTPHRQVSTLRPVSQATFYTSQAGQYTQASVSGHLLHLTGRSVHSGQCLRPHSTPHRQVSTLRPVFQATFYTSQAGQYTQASVSGHILHLTGRSVHSGQCLGPPSTPHRQVSTLRPVPQATFYTSQAGQYTQASASGHLLHITGRSVHSGQCLRPPSTPHRQVSTLRPVSQATFYTSQAGQYTKATVSGHILHLTGRSVHKGHCLSPPSTPHRQVSTLRPLPQATFYTSQAGQYTQATVSGHLLHLTGRSVHSGQCLRPHSTPHKQVSTLRSLSQATFYTSQAGQYTQATVSGHLLHLTGRSVHSGQCLWPPSTPHRQVSTLRPVSQATFYTSQAGQYTQASASGHHLHLTGRSVHSGQCLRPPSTPHRQVSTLRPVPQATIYTSQAGQYTQASVSGHHLHLTGRSVHSGQCLRPPSTPHRQVSTQRPLPQPTFYTSQAGQYTQATASGHLLHLTGRSVHSGHCLRPPSTPHRQVSTLRPLSQATFYTSQAGQYTQASASGHHLHLTGRSVHSGQCLRPHSTPHRQVSTQRPLPQPTFYTSQAGQYTKATASAHLLHLTGRSVHSGHCLRPPSTPHRQVSTLRPLSQATLYTS